MSYASRFSVGSWLEGPAKWLAWAIDTASTPKDQAYNLQQFWKALEPFKKGTRSTQQWGEILLLDSRAQSTYGHHLLLQAALQAKAASVYSVDAAWARSFALGPFAVGSVLPKVREFLAKTDPALKGYQASIRQVYDKAQAAFKNADDTAAKAKQALGSTAASRAQDLAKSGSLMTSTSRGATEAQINATAANAGPQLDLPSLITTPIAGIPLWGWLAGGVALALLLSSGPTVVSMNRLRRVAA